MQTCVQCRACESACPSAVKFGRLMEGARVLLAPRTVPWWQRAAYRILGSRRALGALTAAGAAAQRLRLIPGPLARRLSLPRLPLRQGPLAGDRRRCVALHRLRHGRLAAGHPPGRHRRPRRVRRRRGPARARARRAAGPCTCTPDCTTTPSAWLTASWPPSRARPPSWLTRPAAAPPSRTTATWSARTRRRRSRPGSSTSTSGWPPTPTASPAPRPGGPRPAHRRAGSLPSPPRPAPRGVRPGGAGALRRPGGTGRRRPLLWGGRGVQRPAAGARRPIRTQKVAVIAGDGPRRGGQRQPGLRPVARRGRRSGAPPGGDRRRPGGAAGWPWLVSSRTSGAGWRPSPRSWPTWPWCACGSRSTPAGRELPVDERRLTRARRAVEKAAAILAEPDDHDQD